MAHRATRKTALPQARPSSHTVLLLRLGASWQKSATGRPPSTSDPKNSTYRLEYLEFFLATWVRGLLDSSFYALVLTGLLLYGPDAGTVGAVSVHRPAPRVRPVCGFHAGLVLHLQDGAVGADVVLPIPLQQPPAGLRNAHAVAMEPLLAPVTADHEPEISQQSGAGKGVRRPTSTCY